MTREKLLVELAQLDDQIARAHWAFTRCRRALPAAVACGAQYQRRRVVLELLGGEGSPDVPFMRRD